MGRLRRRRVLALIAAPMALTLPARAGRMPSVRWRGSALGAEATLLIEQIDEARARRLIGHVLAEIDRLENIFSLHRANSALSVLNRSGRLVGPPQEMVDLLTEAAWIHRLSSGAFDPTVQPLWRLHADHFARPDAPVAGPTTAAVEALLPFTGFDKVSIEPAEVSLSGAGMALTLNGIAQGAIADRVADLLRNEGLAHVLIDLGEIVAIGTRPSGAPWSIELGRAPPKVQARGHLTLHDRAVATSDPTATIFAHGQVLHHHLLDPRTGRSSADARAVTVVAPRATIADGLSTALALGPEGADAALRDRLGPEVTILTA
jgi:thiamine biosynthesis lipoprotein